MFIIDDYWYKHVKNIWQVDVKQFTRWNAQSRRQTRICNCPINSVANFQQDISNWAYASNPEQVNLFVQPCACMDRGGKASTMRTGKMSFKRFNLAAQIDSFSWIVPAIDRS